MSIKRIAVGVLTASAVGFVGLVGYEGYTVAVILVPGDVPTIGFGTTEGVRMGDRTTPPEALVRALRDVQKFEGAIKRCVKVPLSQNEYDAYLQLAYNIGEGAFCGSTLVRLLNAGDYAGACEQILRWNKVGGREVRGLTIRRQGEYRLCMKGEIT